MLKPTQCCVEIRFSQFQNTVAFTLGYPEVQLAGLSTSFIVLLSLKGTTATHKTLIALNRERKTETMNARSESPDTESRPIGCNVLQMEEEIRIKGLQ